MIQTQERALEASLLGDPRVSKVKIEGTKLADFVKATVADQLAQIKKTRLTWRAGQNLGEPRDPNMVRGHLRIDKPYIGPIGKGGWYVQNAMVLYRNGKKVGDMNVISNSPVKEQVKQAGGGYIEEVYPSERSRVQDALKIYIREALLLDPHLCPYCVQYSNTDRKQMTHHVFSKHPKEFNAEMAAAGGQPVIEDEPEPEPTPEVQTEVAE
jgi:hypothetical protein